MSIFKDSEKVMQKVFEQTTNIVNINQANMYIKAVEEEFNELKKAYVEKDYVEVLDGIIDVIVTATNLGLSLNMDLQGAWDEILKSNIAKIDLKSGKVNKRQDGKVIKPEGWQPPELKAFLPKLLKK
jgi:predicted HAD superfamily Cof-like phosphohydrolase